MRRNSVLSRAVGTAAVCVLAAGLVVGGSAAAWAADVPASRASSGLATSAPFAPRPGGGHGGHGGHGHGGGYHGGDYGDGGSARYLYGDAGDGPYYGDYGYSGDHGYSDGCEYHYYRGYYNPYDDC